MIEYIGSRITGTYHKHTLILKMIYLTEMGRMHKFAGKFVTSRPFRDDGHSFVSSGDNNMGRDQSVLESAFREDVRSVDVC